MDFQQMIYNKMKKINFDVIIIVMLAITALAIATGLIILITK